MIKQTQVEKTIGAFEQDIILQIIAPKGQFSNKIFNEYFNKESGIFDWVCDEVKQIR